MRLLFFGSPALAVPFLELCAQAPGHDLLAVVTMPDRPSGRGLAMTPPAVKEAGLRLGVPVLQPQTLAAAIPTLETFSPDLIVVVAFGRFLKPRVLAVPRLGCLNVHFSLLPKYRGAAPVQRALMSGESRTGVSLFWIDEGMDSGPLNRQAALEIGPDEDAGALFSRLVELGLSELRAALAELETGTARREPQLGEPTLAPKLSPEEAALGFALPALEFHNRVRGLSAGPRAFLRLRVGGAGKPLRVTVLRTAREPGSGEGSGREPGRILRVERGRGILVEFSVGRLWLESVQSEGKKPQNAADFVNGLRLGPGGRLETAA